LTGDLIPGPDRPGRECLILMPVLEKTPALRRLSVRRMWWRFNFAAEERL